MSALKIVKHRHTVAALQQSPHYDRSDVPTAPRDKYIHFKILSPAVSENSSCLQIRFSSNTSMLPDIISYSPDCFESMVIYFGTSDW